MQMSIDNITNVPGMQSCFRCNKPGFFAYTPAGADYNSCPCCGADDWHNSQNDNDYPPEDDMRVKYPYCNTCGIIWDNWCRHAVCGCTDDVYNAHFVKRWRNTATGETFDGMPQFNSAQHWRSNVNYVEILRFHCPHSSAKCAKSIYSVPADSHANCDF